MRGRLERARQTGVAVLLCGLTGIALAEHPAIAKIRALYAQSQQLDTTVESNLVRMVRTYPAVGDQSTTVRFFGGEEWDEANEAAYAAYQADPYARTGAIVLRKVEVDYNMAASVQCRVEYLFDPLSQQLVFCYTRSQGYECGETRLYFDKERLVRLRSGVADSLCVDSPAARKAATVARDSGFAAAENRQAEQCVARAREYRRAFEDLIILEKLEKGLDLPVKRQAQ